MKEHSTKDRTMGWRDLFSRLFRKSPSSRIEIMETSAGPVKATITTLPLRESEPQTIMEPTSAELEWIAQNLKSAESLVEKHAGPREIEKLEPNILDQAFAGWLEEWKSKKEDPNPIINAIGIAFGQYLIDTLELHWAVVTDNDRTEIAVHGSPGDILVFPANLVAKRFVKRQTGFMVPLSQAIAANVQECRNHWTNKEKP